jgi:uncharacterized membrane protein
MTALGWSRLHGAATHFPIALLFCAAFFDFLALVLHRSSSRVDYQAIGYWLVILSGLGSFVAVVSGLALTQWKLVGTGSLRQHHLFVWPAFALMVGLATWRSLVGKSRLGLLS